MRLVGIENKQEEKSRVKRRKKLRGRGENKKHAWGKKPDS